MKIRITQLDFGKDPTFRTDIAPRYWYIAEYKKHWWSRWRYVMDGQTNCPRLFRMYIDAKNAAIRTINANKDYKAYMFSKERIDTLLKEYDEYNNNKINTRYHIDGEGEY